MRIRLFILFICASQILFTSSTNGQNVNTSTYYAHHSDKNDSDRYKYNFELVKQKDPPLEGDENIADVIQTDDGFLWIATDQGKLLRYDGFSYLPFFPFQQEEDKSHFAFFKINKSKSRKGGMWLVGDSSHICWFDLTNFRSVMVNIKLDDLISDILEDDPYESSLESMFPEGNTDFDYYNSFSTLYKEDGKRFCLYGDSIIVFDTNTYHYHIYSVEGEKGILDAGMKIYNKAKNPIWFYYPKQLYGFNHSKTYHIPYDTYIDHNSYYDDKNNDEWFGRYYDKNLPFFNFFKYDVESKKLYNSNALDSFFNSIYPNLANSLDLKLLLFLCPFSNLDSNNLVINSLIDGLYEFNTEKETFRKISKQIKNFHNLSTDKLLCSDIITDSDENLWLVDTAHRLIKYDKSQDQFILVIRNKKDVGINTIKASDVTEFESHTCVLGNDNSILYTGGNGSVYRINTRTLKINPIKVRDNSLQIQPLCENKAGDILVHSGNDIAIFNVNSKKYVNLGINDVGYDFLGFKAWTDSINNFIISADGGVWIYLDTLQITHRFFYMDIGSEDVLYNHKRDELIFNHEIIIPIEELYPKETLPINITDFKVINNDISFDFSKKLILEYNQNFITLAFSALNFDAGFENKYYLSLQCEDSVWQQKGTSNSITYANLLPGHYVFKVKAYNDHDYTISEEKTLEFDIKPAWWDTPQFKIFASLIGLSFILAILIWLNKNQIQKITLANQIEKEKLQQKQLETEFEKERAILNLTKLQTQLNPHFLSNCLNSIRTCILSNENDDADKYLCEFADLMRDVLDYSKKDKINLSDEMKFLASYIELEKMRFKNKFITDIQDTRHEPVGNIQIPPLLLQPIVENAIKHGLKKDKGLLEIKANIDKNMLVITIKDNGIGRAKAQELKNKSVQQKHEPFGMQLTVDRIAWLNKKSETKSNQFFIEDVLNSEGNIRGTLVTIKLEIL